MRRRALLPILVPLAGFLAGCASTGRPPEPAGPGGEAFWSADAPDALDPDAPESAVVDALVAYYDELSARDWEAFARCFWPGAVLGTVWAPPGETEPRPVLTTVPEFVARAPEGPGSASVFEERMTSARVRVAGVLAQAWARYDARFGEPGELREWSGTDAFTLLLDDGEWRIVSLAYAAE